MVVLEASRCLGKQNRDHGVNKMSRMFPFITETINPLAGECSHKCIGCWAVAFAKRLKFAKYQGLPRIDEKQITFRFEKGEFVFVQDMSDLFAENVPRALILRVLVQISKSPEAMFLLLTKNPKRYSEFDIPSNCVCGATIETDLDNELSNAPSRTERIQAMITLKHPHKMVSVEPIRYFTPKFLRKLLLIQTEFVAVGYDNYDNHFDEPKLEITEILINGLEAYGIKVYRKTIRRAWNKK